MTMIGRRSPLRTTSLGRKCDGRVENFDDESPNAFDLR